MHYTSAVNWARWGQASSVTAGAQAAEEAAAAAAAGGGGGGRGMGDGGVSSVTSGLAAAAGVTLGGSGEMTTKAFELYKLSHNVKKMLGEILMSWRLVARAVRVVLHGSKFGTPVSRIDPPASVFGRCPGRRVWRKGAAAYGALFPKPRLPLPLLRLVFDHSQSMLGSKLCHCMTSLHAVMVLVYVAFGSTLGCFALGYGCAVLQEASWRQPRGSMASTSRHRRLAICCSPTSAWKVLSIRR